MIGSTASHATLMGWVWTDEDSPGVVAAAGNATIAQVTALGGLGTADATFTTNSLNYSVPDSTTATVAQFLATGGTTCTNGPGGTGCGDILNNSYFFFASAPGFTENAVPGPNGGTDNIVAILHDDGIQLAIDTTGTTIGSGTNIITSPTPTPPTPSTAAFVGNHTVQLSYGETAQGPAVLQANLVDVAVPEPASLALLGAALVGFSVMGRRRKTS